MKRVAIIGSGVGGLGLACLLGKKGYAVTVYEKNDQLGGRASVFESDGFRFDMGPSWYLMPEIFEHFFSLLGERIDDHLELMKLQPSYRAHFMGKGKVEDFFSDFRRDRETVERLEPGAGTILADYLSRSRAAYNIATSSFLYRNYDSIKDFLNWQTLQNGRKLNVFQNMERFVNRQFKSLEMRQLMQYHLTFLGSPPPRTPAIYSILSHVDFDQGVYYPKGGIYQLIKSLVRLGAGHGVKYQVGSAVQRIITRQGRASGLLLESGETVEADIIVSNADMHHTETTLLDSSARTLPERYWKNRLLAPSAVILYLGIKGRIPGAVHHNLFFSSDWQLNSQQIFDSPGLPDDASFYACVPSITDDTAAPAGMENMFVLVPVGSRVRYSAEQLEAYSEKILNTLAVQMKVPDLRSRIVFRRMFSPADFSQRYNSYGGSALGLAHTLRQSAFMRPSNVSRKVSNLYYVGANTNPGIGMPTCLISAELAYKRITRNQSSAPLPKL